MTNAIVATIAIWVTDALERESVIEEYFLLDGSIKVETYFASFISGDGMLMSLSGTRLEKTF
ncbi:hypothetical protein [uncultured Bartonella sp.]|uniref:hypothetical protein n=1 Tax=uncultured Bartonella sp. TaxID=104108 RepID=UPI0026172EA3|nr:hypothetical protein [uncultured Bartonella sp.]